MQPEIKPIKKLIPQLKIADMISMSGAGLTGLGIGATINEHLVGVVPVFILFGMVLLGLGMYGKFQIERAHIDPPPWVILIFGACWVGLMLTALYILIGHYAVTI